MSCSVEVMRAKVNIGLGFDFENEITPSWYHFSATSSGPKIGREDEALEK